MALMRLPVVLIQFASAVQTPAVVAWATEVLVLGVGAIGHKYKAVGGWYYSGILEQIQSPAVSAQ